MLNTKEDELAIERGLLIKEYPSKWKQAKSVAIRADKDSYAEGTAFEYACRLFLQLGGKQEGNFYGLLNAESIK